MIGYLFKAVGLIGKFRRAFQKKCAPWQWLHGLTDVLTFEEDIMKNSVRVIFGALMGSLYFSAFADTVVYNNFGPDDSYSGQGYTVGTPLPGHTYSHAMQFSPSQDGLVSAIDVGMGYLVAGENAFAASIRADNSGVPGTVLESIDVFDQVSDANGVNGIVSFSAAGITPLDSLNTYWLVLEPISSSSDFFSSWIRNDQGESGNKAFSKDAGITWSTGTVTLGAFRVSVAGNVSTLTCTGFESPLASGPVTVKKNRALPFKAQLTDPDGFLVDNSGIFAPPVIQVTYDDYDGDATDVSDDVVSAGAGTDGNQFEFENGKWQLNLKVKDFTAPGTYTVTMESGNNAEYQIDPTCTSQFVIY